MRVSKLLSSRLHIQAKSKDLHYGRTSVYSLQYHLILVTKYRRDVIVGDVKDALSKLLTSLCEDMSVTIVAMELMPDHVHLLIDAKPTTAISSVVKGLKGVSAKLLFRDHPVVKSKLWGGHLWQPSYFACTVSERSQAMIKEYIESQEVRDGC